MKVSITGRSLKEKRLYDIINTQCDSDTEDEGSDNEKDVKFIFMPDNGIKKTWDIFIAL